MFCLLTRLFHTATAAENHGTGGARHYAISQNDLWKINLHFGSNVE
jgi:hypothetical protein